MPRLAILGIVVGAILAVLSAIALAISGLAAGLTGWTPVDPHAYYMTLFSIMMGGGTLAFVIGMAAADM